MKHKNPGELGYRESSCALIYVSLLIACPAFIFFTCMALLALFAIGIVQSLIAGSIALLAQSIGSFATMVLEMLSMVAYAIWLVLTGEWGRLIRLLPELLDWLRNLGLL